MTENNSSCCQPFSGNFDGSTGRGREGGSHCPGEDDARKQGGAGKTEMT